MRRRWEINKGTVQGILVTWFLVGFAVSLICALAWRDHDSLHQDAGPATGGGSPTLIVFAAWLAPFIVIIVVGLAMCAVYGVQHIWHHPPISRVIEPIKEDLREER